MAPKIPPSELSSLASLAFAKQIINFTQGNHYHDEAIFNSVQKYLEKLPVFINDYLLDIILSYNIDCECRIQTMRLLLNSQTQTLKVGSFPEIYHKTVLELMRDKCDNLKNLDMRGFWIKNENILLFKFVLMKLPQLKVLWARHIVNDKIMTTILRYNPLLKILDISGNSIATSLESLERNEWPSLSNLKILDIGGIHQNLISPEMAALMLEHFPSLISFGSYPSAGKALSIFASKTEKRKKTKLAYIRDSQTSITILNQMKELCPDLISIYLDRPRPGIIRQLSAFKKLRNIKLNSFYCEELEFLVYKCGRQIETLELLIGKGRLKIMNIFEACPNLLTLDVFKINYIAINIEQSLTCKLLKFDIWCSNYEPELINKLFVAMPFIEHLNIDDYVPITDDDVENFLNMGIWQSLKSLRLHSANNLTIKALWLLINNCPFLESVYGVSNWNILPQELIDTIQILEIDNYKFSLNP